MTAVTRNVPDMIERLRNRSLTRLGYEDGEDKSFTYPEAHNLYPDSNNHHQK